MSDWLSSEDARRKSLTCYYCGLYHRHVEAGGMWYCPNPLCHGPGGAWCRSTCKTYKDTDGINGSHTVDEMEWARVAYQCTVDPEVATARDSESDKWCKGYRPNKPAQSVVTVGGEFP